MIKSIKDHARNLLFSCNGMGFAFITCKRKNAGFLEMICFATRSRNFSDGMRRRAPQIVSYIKQNLLKNGIVLFFTLICSGGIDETQRPVND